eukprot:CAMPEP_0198513182 /NCGR_PEP_ID=MMETSP1462-20131121/15905_1 /TAXON_ID=1333877 /ORGANISM="Brandtodinium nutriculum, Strain RCC3387" /LENGTH=215 /DNA_ID=CAMNT_0044242603 /DNA_START=64 /DNA_END=707 /DNA_ORIENTATION=-
MVHSAQHAEASLVQRETFQGGSPTRLLKRNLAIAQLHAAVGARGLVIVHPLAKWDDACNVPLPTDLGVRRAVLLVRVLAVGLDEVAGAAVQKLEVVVLRLAVAEPEGRVGRPQHLVASEPRALDEAVAPMRAVVAEVPLRITAAADLLPPVVEGQLEVGPVDHGVGALPGRQPRERVPVREADLQLGPRDLQGAAPRPVADAELRPGQVQDVAVR